MSPENPQYMAVLVLLAASGFCGWFSLQMLRGHTELESRGKDGCGNLLVGILSACVCGGGVVTAVNMLWNMKPGGP